MPVTEAEGAVISMISAGSVLKQKVSSTGLTTPADVSSFSRNSKVVSTGLPGQNGSVASTVTVATWAGPVRFGITTAKVVFVLIAVQVVKPLTVKR